ELPDSVVVDGDLQLLLGVDVAEEAALGHSCRVGEAHDRDALQTDLTVLEQGLLEDCFAGGFALGHQTRKARPFGRLQGSCGARTVTRLVGRPAGSWRSSTRLRGGASEGRRLVVTIAGSRLRFVPAQRLVAGIP